MDDIMFTIIGIISLAISSAAVGSFLTILYLNGDLNILSIGGTGEIENVSLCHNETIQETAECLNSYVKGIYNYKVTSDDFERPIQIIEKNGGDCLDYSRLYQYYFQALGYKADIKVINTDEDFYPAHAFVIAYDEKSNYCLMDQETYQCWVVG